MILGREGNSVTRVTKEVLRLVDQRVLVMPTHMTVALLIKKKLVMHPKKKESMD
jgi:hypothetical protein